MKNPCIALLLLCALGTEPLSATEYRFQALIDLDGDPTSGCAVESGGTTLQGSELRTVARSDRDQVLEVVLQSCRDAGWQDEHRSLESLPIAFAQGEAGSDQVRWTLPLSAITAPPRLSLRVLSERSDLQAHDIVGQGTEAQVLDLLLGESARPLPALGGIALLSAVLALVWLGRRHLRRFGQYASWGAASPLVLGIVLLAQPIARAHADMANSAVALDVANDSADAGSDILRARIAVVGETLEFQIDVNNIEDNGLGENARILFIGNSLTYFNHLPLMLQAIAAQAGKVLVADAITLGGASLEEHYLQQTAHAALANGGYQWVIMQQGPSSLPESQNHLRTWASRFDPLIRAGGARPALYMVWPDATRIAYFNDVYQSYSNAALAINGMFIPAGETWRGAWRANPGLPLYGDDQFHPSALGSYAAGLSIFAELYQQSPENLPTRLRLSNGVEFEFDPSQARGVQAAAWRTHIALGRRGG